MERAEAFPKELRQQFNSIAAILLLDNQEMPKRFHWYQKLQQVDNPELIEIFGPQLAAVQHTFKQKPQT